VLKVDEKYIKNEAKLAFQSLAPQKTFYIFRSENFQM
jgi:hypothetical protein